MSSFELTLVKNIPASPKVVFEAWLDPKALAQFMTPKEGMSVSKAESAGQVGGDFLVVMKAGDQEMPHSGTYKTVEKYSKLVFTWVSPFYDTASLVTLTFAEKQPGHTELTLFHTGLTSEESRENHQGGWTQILDVLRRVVA